MTIGSVSDNVDRFVSIALTVLSEEALFSEHLETILIPPLLRGLPEM